MARGEVQKGSQGEPAKRSAGAVLLVLGVLGVLFAVLNTQRVQIDWIVTTTHAPLIVVIALCGLVGFSVGTLAARRKRP